MKVCPKCKSKNIISVEYWYGNAERYDGISEYACHKCGYRQGRWTGQEIKSGYVEPRLGRGGKPVKRREE